MLFSMLFAVSQLVGPQSATCLLSAAAVQSLIEDAIREFNQPLRPACSTTRAEKPLWTIQDFETVMEKLTEAPHHAVAEQDMQVALGSRGDEVLRSFVLIQYCIMCCM